MLTFSYPGQNTAGVREMLQRFLYASAGYGNSLGKLSILTRHNDIVLDISKALMI
jgi:hypothetical protein